MMPPHPGTNVLKPLYHDHAGFEEPFPAALAF
jgi:hypothetical protein